MAGGIDWLRWHHGSVTDPKFQLVARRAGASVAEVVAVWAFLLEQASMSDDRGNPGEPDLESIDCALGMEDGRAHAIYTHMLNRALVSEDGRITSWDKRQPKREREDDNSTERVRAFRQKKRNETPCNAEQRQETPRVEESREEERRTTTPSDQVASTTQPETRERTSPTRAGKVCVLLRENGVQDAAPHHLTDSDWSEILAKRTDEEIVAFAVAKLAARPGQRTGLKYLAPGLLEDPRPASRSPPGRMTREESRRIAYSTRLSDFRAACAAEQQEQTDDSNAIEGTATRLLG